MNAIDVCFVMWQPLPAPADKYILARFRSYEETTCCEVATDQDGNFLNTNGTKLTDVEEIDAWAYMPYDDN